MYAYSSKYTCSIRLPLAFYFIPPTSVIIYRHKGDIIFINIYYIDQEIEAR